jgi:hypothetical protein
MKARYIVVLALSSSFILPAQAGGELAVWKRLAPIVERGAVRSPTLARVVAEVRALDGVTLRVTQRPQPSSRMRAHSSLRVERGARPVRVDGEVLLPVGRSEPVVLSLLAHELAHVLQQAGVFVPGDDDPRGEEQAASIERAVLAELAPRG